MDDFLKSVYCAALNQQDAYPKALANFMFREIIEDAHTKYNISQEDMKQMCKTAVNRAAVYIALQEKESLRKAFAIEAIDGLEWDAPEFTEDLKEKLIMFHDIANFLDEHK